MTTESLAPVAPAERVETIDILRGLALFGILAANIRGFAGPAATYFMPHLMWPALHDRLAQAFIDIFVQQKFLTIFAFLFGVGFAVQFERAQGRRFAWTYTRRLLILIVFGLVHGLLIWFGDILLVYGLTGLLLLLFRKRADKTLLVWAGIGFLVPLLLMMGMAVAVRAGMPAPPMRAPSASVVAGLTATFASGTWMDIQRQRMTDAVAHNWGFFPILLWHVGALFLLGMVAWRRRLLQPAPESLPRYRRVMTWALAIGVTANVAGTALRSLFQVSMMPTNGVALVATLVRFIGTPALSLGYITLVVVLCNDPVWKARLRRFGAVGRTALTNYLLQSVIGTLLFYSYGLGLFGKLGPALLLPLTVVLFAAQVALSGWWVARFRFGPVEWLWRSLTYGRHFALVDASIASVPATPAERPAR
jgi:uncharacterized protein